MTRRTEMERTRHYITKNKQLLETFSEMNKHGCCGTFDLISSTINMIQLAKEFQGNAEIIMSVQLGDKQSSATEEKTYIKPISNTTAHLPHIDFAPIENCRVGTFERGLNTQVQLKM
ncbi:hypothetical protein AKO1_002337 [Acrasis kona]|uniref:Uncharacterized protein n=1 Tax=Acrasis kona TaxID=1008807 RepID=A0AAW2Z6C8_9EUKA